MRTKDQETRSRTPGKARSSLAYIVVALLVLLLSGCRASMPSQEAIAVQQVISGREVEIGGLAGYPDITERLLLAGIDSPDEAQSPWGAIAKQTLERLIQSNPVVPEASVEPETDQGQRLVYLWQNGTLLNEALVEQGYAIAQPSSPPSKYDQRLAHAQDRARLLGLGIWNPQQPMRQSPSEARGNPARRTQP